MNYLKLLLLFQFFAFLSFGQLNNNSPYSKYGLGQLSGTPYANNFGMAGLSIGVLDSNHVNGVNPASGSFLNYTHAEFGIKSKYSAYNTGTETNTELNGHLSHFTLGFPLGKSKNIGFISGMTPYSTIGYSFKNTLENSVASYDASGGLTNVFTGLSYRKKGVSFGVNAKYFFGKSIKYDAMRYDDNLILDYYQTNDDRIKGYALEYGILYKSPKLKNGIEIGFGATFQPSQFLRIDRNAITFQVDNTNGVDSLLNLTSVNSNGLVQLPGQFGVGFTLNQSSKWMLGVDYQSTQWSNYTYFAENGGLMDQSEFKIGFQYAPDPMARTKGIAKGQTWKEGLLYRTGFRYSNSFVGDENTQLTELGISFGIDVVTPFNINYEVPSFWTFAVEVGKMGTTNGVWLEERFVKLNFAYTFSDRWFKKSRIN